MLSAQAWCPGPEAWLTVEDGLSKAVNALYRARPADPLAFLGRYLLALSVSTEEIQPVVAARQISRGETSSDLRLEQSRTIDLFYTLVDQKVQSLPYSGTVRRASKHFSDLSALHRAHMLAERYHAYADRINVGTAAIQAECTKELRAVLRSPQPGRQVLLNRYKHIDVVIDELLTIQHMVTGSQTTQLQTALIAPNQQLKPKLASLMALAADHPIKAKLREALAQTRVGSGVDDYIDVSEPPRGADPDAMLSHLVELNDELYDVIGQLAVTISEAKHHNPGYQPFNDHELHSPDHMDC